MRRTGWAALGAAGMLAACGGGDDAATSAAAEGADSGGGDASRTAAMGGGGLPDGAYACAYNSGGMLYTLGEVKIDGDRYAGFSGNDWGRYSLNADQTIDFRDGFVGLPDNFSVQGAAWRTSTQGNRYIEVNYGRPGGFVLTATCEVE